MAYRQVARRRLGSFRAQAQGLLVRRQRQSLSAPGLNGLAHQSHEDAPVDDREGSLRFPQQSAQPIPIRVGLAHILLPAQPQEIAGVEDGLQAVPGGVSTTDTGRDFLAGLGVCGVQRAPALP